MKTSRNDDIILLDRIIFLSILAKGLVIFK